MTGIETRRMNVDDIETSVLVGGVGQPGEAVLFVHGNPDSGGDWMPLMKPVAEFATVVAPDLPGFGAAGARADGDYTVGAYARFLNGVIEELGIERVHLVAHDFGGPIAMTWAAWHPDRVASVTLVNTAVFSPLKLKSRSPECSIGRGNLTISGRPCSASCARTGPPGYGRPSSLAVLSNASPAASSSVSPSKRYSPTPVTRISWLCPPETSSAMKGNFGGRLESSGERRCPSR